MANSGSQYDCCLSQYLETRRNRAPPQDTPEMITYTDCPQMPIVWGSGSASVICEAASTVKVPPASMRATSDNPPTRSNPHSTQSVSSSPADIFETSRPHHLKAADARARENGVRESVGNETESAQPVPNSGAVAPPDDQI